MEEKKELEKQAESLMKEFESYMEESKGKKVYSVSLTEKNVKLVRDTLKDVPFSKILDDFIGILAMTIKRREEKEQGETKELNSEGEKSDTEKKD